MILALLGCPFVFGPPDLSNVDAVHLDTSVPVRDSTAPVPSGDTASETTDPTTTEDPPSLEDVSVAPWVGGWRVSFTGPVTLATIEVDAVAYEVPSALQAWDPVTGRGHVVLAGPDPCVEQVLDFEVLGRDALGQAGPAVHATARVAQAAGTSSPLELTLPGVVCGTTGEGDLLLEISPSGPGDTVELSWGDESDMDLIVLDANGVIGSSVGFAQPETVTAPITGAPLTIQIVQESPQTPLLLSIR